MTDAPYPAGHTDTALPQLRDGDTVECVAFDPRTEHAEQFEGVAIVDEANVVLPGQPPVLLVETEIGIVLPDPRYPGPSDSRRSRLVTAEAGLIRCRVAYLVACVECRLRLEDHGHTVAAMVGELRAMEQLCDLPAAIGPDTDLLDRLSVVLQAWKELR
jgi:hypothetical protein